VGEALGGDDDVDRGRERDEQHYVQRLEERLASDDVPDLPSGEMVAPLSTR